MDFSNTYCNSYVSPSVQTILDPGVGGQHPLILRHHHHVRLPRLVDEYLSGSSGLQELWCGPPLCCPWYKLQTLVLKNKLWVNVELNDLLVLTTYNMIHLQGIMSMGRVESSWSQPHKTSIHLERRSLESAPSGILSHLLAGELSSQTGCANNHCWLQVVQSSQHGLQLISITIHNLQGDLPRQLGIDLSLNITIVYKYC